MNEFGNLSCAKTIFVAQLRGVLKSISQVGYKEGYVDAFMSAVPLVFSKKEQEYLLSKYPDIFPA